MSISPTTVNASQAAPGYQSKNDAARPDDFMSLILTNTEASAPKEKAKVTINASSKNTAPTNATHKTVQPEATKDNGITVTKVAQDDLDETVDDTALLAVHVVTQLAAKPEIGVDIAIEAVDGTPNLTADIAAALASLQQRTGLTLTFDDVEAPETQALDPDAQTNGELSGDILTLDVEGQKKFLDLLNHLLAGLPADSKVPATAAIIPATTPVIAADIVPQTAEQTTITTSATLASVTTPATQPALIATGLSPEQITSIQTALANLQNNPEAQTENPLLGLVKLQPVESKEKAVFTPQTWARPAQAPMQPAPTPATANATITATTTAQASQAIADKKAELVSKLNALLADDGTAPEDSAESDGFNSILKILEEAQAGLKKDSVQFVANASTKSSAQPNANSNNVANLSTVALQNAATTDQALAFSSELSGDIYPDGIDWAHFAGSATHALSLNGPSMMTSLVNTAPQAINPHPATQIVSAALGKAAADGQTKAFTIRLDPAELGRVDIRMEFAKDKTMKAHMVVEKAETYMMLQRDSHVLQRTLQEAGLDTSGNSLSFELSQHGNQNDQHSGRHDNGGTGSSAGHAEADAIEIIETTMDWHVDAHTGMTHYNLLV